MHTRPFGPTSVLTSEVGLGCWQFSTDWGDISDDGAMKVLHAAIDAGINFLDTADVYGAGRSESLIGRFRKERSDVADSLVIATKLGRLHGYLDGYSLDLFRRCTQDSIKRLGVEALDLTQTHCIPPHYTESGEAFDWLRTLQKEGLIKAFGASVESVDEGMACLKHEGVASLQVIFNVFRQKPITTLFAEAKRKNVAIIARVPLASGLLSGRFTKTTTFSENDHRNYNKDGQAFNPGETFAGLPFEKGVGLVDELRAMLTEAGLLSGSAKATMAQLALRWILDCDAVSVVIPGAKNAQQVKGNAGASELPSFSLDLHDKLSQWYEKKVKPLIRGVY